jgi:4-diphosphocytidyl-2-C-methyl-D-erythritol kinase
VRALYDLAAPAKLNLFLHVTGRREDGYHLLQSAFRLIDWCDTLQLELRDNSTISRADVVDLGLPVDDLSVRAARLLQQASGTTMGVHITLDKQVPWGAGLGGGSSDAATTLLGLNRLWGLNWPRSQLATLALQLGADVPFFIAGHNAWVEGIGEKITPIELPPARYVVLKPAEAIPTSVIFSSALLQRNTPPAIVASFLADPGGFGRNDLQPCATSHSSQVQVALDMLAAAFSASRMSGSGSAVFAEVGHMPEAELSGTLQRLLATVPAGWTIRQCDGLAVHPLQGWAAD